MLIAINRTDGGVSVMRVVPQPPAQSGNDPAIPHVEAEIAKWSAAHRDAYTYASHHAIREADLPADRTFRNAWTSDGKRIVHDMEQCRAIHRERMRQARTPKLAALDIAYQRADEMKDESAKTAIAAQKQALRDVTNDQRIGAAQTPEELKAIWPAILA